MKQYKVKPEYQDAWFGGLSTDEIGDAIVTEDEIRRLAREWDVSMDELMEQVEDGEHTYKDYFAANPTENPNWCVPYIKGNNAVCVNDVTTDEISAIMIDGVEIDFRDDKTAVKRLAQRVNDYYDDYKGWSDAHIATQAMKEVGCAYCPWFERCDQMNEILK